MHFYKIEMHTLMLLAYVGLPSSSLNGLRLLFFFFGFLSIFLVICRLSVTLVLPSTSSLSDHVFGRKSREKLKN